ncbi:MAG: hypothetical protein A4S12_06885 [Proteobacteria bacterium SG_bin5]|nr:phage Gp37/Gp68 family protein [Sphingomonas sp.]OQW42058.1 MAG: hypothetical protein A4S12_06885 [Proteobacteria bacterium SG_bin5]
MAETTAISWAHATFNAWQGCTRISPACDNCYAAARAHRFGDDHLWAGELRRTSADYWRAPLKWNRAAEREGKPRRVFCASLGDVFDNQAPQAWRDDLWALIETTPWLTWMLLTKRPQKIVGMVPPRWLIEPPKNVWYGATIENRETLRQRLHHLREVPATLRFISAEPLLEQIAGDELRNALGHPHMAPLGFVGLVIAGGESGPKARASHPDDFRGLRDLCAIEGAVFHFKQWGNCVPGSFDGEDEYGHPAWILDEEHFGDRDVPDELNRWRSSAEYLPGYDYLRFSRPFPLRHLDGVIHDDMPPAWTPPSAGRAAA